MQEQAWLFGREAERYDRTRPGYPAAALEEIVGRSAEGLAVLDVACGTGIASRQLAERGASVLGVEPNPEMAEIAERHGIPVEIATFEDWDPAGRSFDRVVCAQAWHWLDPEVSAPKSASVLRPGGRLCLVWSIGSYPDELADAITAVYASVLPVGIPRPVIGYAANRSSDPTADFRPVEDSIRATGSFDEPKSHWFPWTRRYSRDLWLDELMSHSDHIALPEGVRAPLFDAIATTIDDHGGGFDMPLRTLLISATRR